MKIFLTGVTGQLGQEVKKYALAAGHEVVAPTRAELDLLDKDALEQAVMTAAPDAILHCAAYTAVDQAEEEPKVARAVNAEATQVLAECANRLGAKILYVSTDYVFDGGLDLPYDNVDECHPLNVYGETKYLGELVVEACCDHFFVVRTSWVFSAHGTNFVKTILHLADTKEEISVVQDQIGSPTYAPDLAVLLLEMIQTEEYGFYHATNEGQCSFYEFAEEIVRQSGKQLRILPISSDAYGARAPRPHNSVLAKDSLDRSGFHRLPDWKDALARCLKELQ